MAASQNTTTITAEAGVPQILITREFAASPELLLRAHTEPDLLVQWLGPRNQTMVIDHFEPRNGGAWRYVHREPDGTEYGFRGVFHGMPSLDGIVQTFEFEGAPGNVALETLTFEAQGDRTVLHANSVYQTVEARNALIESGMEVGVNEGYERLDELIVGQKAAG